MNNSIFIKQILFLGDKKKASISFNNHLHIIHGASNTGKSLLINAIDYMFGSEKLKEAKPESDDYSEIAMKLYLNKKPYTVYRKISSNTFEVYNGFIDSKNEEHFYSLFKHGKATLTVKNISDFYLGELEQVEISSNLYAEKCSLSIRLLSRVFISSEERIISSDSPIVAGDTSEDSKNKNVFKFLLTGKDDSKTKTITRENEFKSEKKGKLETLADVVNTLEFDLNYPNESIEELKERKARLNLTIESLKSSMDLMNESISETIKRKKEVATESIYLDEKINNTKSNIINFETLEKIYISDIERLNSQEEAAFLLSIGHNAQCKYCGKSPEKICNDLLDIEQVADASKVEIIKIRNKISELNEIRTKLNNQLENSIVKSKILIAEMNLLDNEIKKRTPETKIINDEISKLKSEKNTIDTEISLLERINIFRKKLQETEVSSVPKKYSSPDFQPEKNVIESFCKTYKNILCDINFPGKNEVSFDFKNYDVIIDGKARSSNGKGVRAILHSVFKIALLQHCKENNLYHPGFIILDSPLVTYRDPLKSKYGNLTNDEQELANTKVSYHFLKYLKNNNIGQFIIVENIDIPQSLLSNISIDTFYGKNAEHGQRAGLL